jgi:protein-S-isoprenylcysteine O-methyltransferase Ste14
MNGQFDYVMALVYRYLFTALWLAWAAYWWARSFNVKRTAKVESLGSRLTHLVPLVLGVWLVMNPVTSVPLLARRYLPDGAWTFWLGASVLLVGLGITVWARRELGRNWSGIVTLKEGHELVTGGPYRFVRHPIYTGLLLGMLGSALVRAQWGGLLGVVLATVSFWRKLTFEERFMREQFGAAYDDYSKRVAALVPFLL